MNIENYNDLIKFLKLEFNRRQKSNPKYSLRAYASHLNIAKTSISNLFLGKRKLSIPTIKKIGKSFNISEEIIKKIILSMEKNIIIDSEYKTLEKNEFELMTEWYFIAILSLAQFKHNEANSEWIISKLNISKLEAQNALDILIKLNLIEIKNNKLIRTSEPVKFYTDTPSELIRKYHKQNLDLARKSIDDLHMNERVITAVSIPSTRKKLEKTLSLIDKAKYDIADSMSSKNPDQIYNIAIQVFPVSKK